MSHAILAACAASRDLSHPHSAPVPCVRAHTSHVRGAVHTQGTAAPGPPSPQQEDHKHSLDDVHPEHFSPLSSPRSSFDGTVSASTSKRSSLDLGEHLHSAAAYSALHHHHIHLHAHHHIRHPHHGAATCRLGRPLLSASELAFLRAAFKKLKPGDSLAARHLRPLGRGGVGEVALLELPLPGGGTLQLAHKVAHCKRYDARRHAREVASMEMCAGCPYVQRLYGASRGPKPPFGLYTEYAPAGNLAQVLERRRQGRRCGYSRGAMALLEEAELRWLGARLLAALRHVHAQRLVHRDLKAANIFFTSAGSPLLADFDMAELADEDGYVYGAAGTLATAAPEVRAAAYGGGRYDARADMWSLGMVLLEALTERAPQDGPDLAAVASPELADLVLGGLLVPAAKRLTAEAAAGHPFFASVDFDWAALEAEAPPLSLLEELQVAA